MRRRTRLRLLTVQQPCLSNFDRVLVALGAAGLVGGTWWTLVPPAAAAFPGANGDIAFVSTRNNNVAIYQVDPSATGIGSSSGDKSNTTSLTDGAVHAEPFY